MGNVNSAGTVPSVFIPIPALDLLLGLTVGFKIFQHKEFVIPVQQCFLQLAEHGIFFHHFQHAADICIIVVNIPGRISSFLIIPLYFIRPQSEDHAVFVPYFLMDLHVAPSMVPKVMAPLNINFMFPVPDASLLAVEICSLTSAEGNNSCPRDTL